MKTSETKSKGCIRLLPREKDGGKWYVRGDTIFTATFAGPGYKFDETSNSKDLYHDVIKQVVISAKQGKTFPPVSVEVLGSNCRSSSSLFIGTVFAYGQTFSGKTHTMAGSGPETIYIFLSCLHLILSKALPRRAGSNGRSYVRHHQSYC